jgi:Flp pilus assembly protein TadG
MRTLPAKHPCRRRNGAAAVEFAVVAPVVILLLMGIFEYGRFGFTMATCTGAARDAARYAAVHTSDKTSTDVFAILDNRMGPAKSQVRNYNAAGNRKVYWVDPTEFAKTPPVVQPKNPGNVEDWKNTPFGDKVAVEINGTFHPVMATILRAPASFTLKIREMVTCEAN